MKKYLEIIAGTTFYTALASYLLFALADYLRPGFVSFVFSVHWFSVVAIISGIVWSLFWKAPSTQSSKIWGILTNIILGLILFIIFWREGEAFGDFRTVVALIGLVLPWLITRLLNTTSK